MLQQALLAFHYCQGPLSLWQVSLVRGRWPDRIPQTAHSAIRCRGAMQQRTTASLERRRNQPRLRIHMASPARIKWLLRSIAVLGNQGKTTMTVLVYAAAANSNSRACAADAMQCPDGSWIGRTGPNCTFICPATNSNGSCVTADGVSVPNGYSLIPRRAGDERAHDLFLRRVH